MRTTALAIALLLSGTAIAQTTSDADMTTDTEVTTQADVTTDSDPMATDMSTSTDTTPDMTTATDPAMPVDTTTHTTLAVNTVPASGAIVQPSNAAPERDARGIAVMSDPAVVPAGFNGVTGTAVGGPLVDPATGETVESADASYPACTATVTDNCIQTYEVGRS